MKIYLADLVHTWEKASTWTFPLNIGFIGSYVKEYVEGDIEVVLFKRPEKLLEALRNDPPDVLGLSYYVWNTNLSSHFANIAKRENPSMLVVGGGPNFTSLNYGEDHAKGFFANYKSLDAFVVNQGERAFAELMKAFISADLDVAKLRKHPVPGCAIRLNEEGSEVHLGEQLEAIRDLDEIPSPYLSGMLDEFFDEPFAPVLETNRSCPYRCTFCAWGIGTAKLAKFSIERIKAEIEYISERCHNAVQLFIADANFGILPRDIEIAEMIAESNRKTGFPGHLAVQWNKSKPERVLETAKRVKNFSRIGASMQSLDDATLEAVKRKNMSLDNVLFMLDELRKDGSEMPLVSELILGLPEETRESHMDANRRLMDLGAEMINYNLYLLEGTEMATAESRAKYFKETGWRLMDNAFGIYDGAHIFEGQETVQATTTMSRDELRGFRFFHFLLQFMWGHRWYMDYLQFFRNIGVHPVDMIDRVTEAARIDNGPVGEVYADFKADHDLEAFGTFEDLESYWREDEHFERLRKGDYGKLNFAFTYRVVLENKADFDQFLLQQAERTINEVANERADELMPLVKEVIRFCDLQWIKFTENLELKNGTEEAFDYDFLKWREQEYQGLPAPSGKFGNRVEFYLSDAQEKKLNTLISQYRTRNTKMTLRKMAEYIKPHEFFYHCRPVIAN